MKWALFMMGEYTHIIVASALGTTLFLGGWQGPLLPPVVWFMFKTFALVFFFIWVQRHLPPLPLRSAHATGLEGPLPCGLANIVVTGVVILFLKG